MIVQELYKIQNRHGYLPRAELLALAERLTVPLYRIQQVLSFFPHYRTTPPPDLELNICENLACQLNGAGKLIADLQAANQHRAAQVKVCGVSCLGRCDRPPAARIYDHRREPAAHHHDADHDHPVYNLHGRSAAEIQAILDSLLSGASAATIPNDSDAAHSSAPENWLIDIYAGQPAAERYASIRRFAAAGQDENSYSEEGHTEFSRRQERERILRSLQNANLLGMGGAGGRAYKKWEEVLQAAGEKKYVVCNGDESEPGTFKDRELFLRTPHLVVEGVILAGLVVGATKGYIYIRHEYEEQIAAVRAEIRAAEELRVCGNNILGGKLSFPVEVFVSPGGYICGEQTALIQAIQDERAEPRNRPPELQTNGLWDCPTLLNNVETLAWAPAIVNRDDGRWYAGQGAAEEFKGARFFSVSGDVARPGVCEVPIGIKLGELIARCGGMKDGVRLKGVALSGPSGGFLPARLPLASFPPAIKERLPAGATDVDITLLELDLGLFRKWNLMLGAGIVIYGDQADMVDQALSSVKFYQKESCGKCVPCRIGSTRIAEVTDDLARGKLGAVELAEMRKRDGSLQELALTMRNTAICGLGTVAANPLTTLLTHFEEDVAQRTRS